MWIAYPLSELLVELRIIFGLCILLYTWYCLGFIDLVAKYLATLELRRVINLPIEIDEVKIDFYGKKAVIKGLRVNAPPIEVDDRWDLDNIVTISVITVTLYNHPVYGWCMSFLYWALSFTELVIFQSAHIEGLRFNVEGYRGLPTEKVYFNQQLLGKKVIKKKRIFIPSLYKTKEPCEQPRTSSDPVQEAGIQDTNLDSDSGVLDTPGSNRRSSGDFTDGKEENIWSERVTPPSSTRNLPACNEGNEDSMTVQQIVSSTTPFHTPPREKACQASTSTSASTYSGPNSAGVKPSGTSSSSNAMITARESNSPKSEKSTDPTTYSNSTSNPSSPTPRNWQSFLTEKVQKIQKNIKSTVKEIKSEAIGFQKTVKKSGFIPAAKQRLSETYSKTKQSIEESINEKIANFHVKCKGLAPPRKFGETRILCDEILVDSIELHLKRALPVQLRHLEKKPMLVPRIRMQRVGFEDLLPVQSTIQKDTERSEGDINRRSSSSSNSRDKSTCSIGSDSATTSADGEAPMGSSAWMWAPSVSPSPSLSSFVLVDGKAGQDPSCSDLDSNNAFVVLGNTEVVSVVGRDLLEEEEANEIEVTCAGGRTGNPEQGSVEHSGDNDNENENERENEKLIEQGVEKVEKETAEIEQEHNEKVGSSTNDKKADLSVDPSSGDLFLLADLDTSSIDLYNSGLGINILRYQFERALLTEVYKRNAGRLVSDVINFDGWTLFTSSIATNTSTTGSTSAPDTPNLSTRLATVVAVHRSTPAGATASLVSKTAANTASDSPLPLLPSLRPPQLSAAAAAGHSQPPVRGFLPLNSVSENNRAIVGVTSPESSLADRVEDGRVRRRGLSLVHTDTFDGSLPPPPRNHANPNVNSDVNTNANANANANTNTNTNTNTNINDVNTNININDVNTNINRNVNTNVYTNVSNNDTDSAGRVGMSTESATSVTTTPVDKSPAVSAIFGRSRKDPTKTGNHTKDVVDHRLIEKDPIFFMSI